MDFDTVVGLGGNCEVAQHLRRHFQLDRAQIFDWWITPFAGAIQLLDEDFRHLFQPDALVIIGDRLAVQCTRSGVIHHHDFPRDSLHLVLPEEIASSLPTLREKYDALRRRFNEVCESGQRVLFVRNWREILHAPPDYPQHWVDGMPRPDFAGLIEVLARRYPDLDFRILFVNYGMQTIDHPRALFDNVVDRGDVVDWSGSALGWSELFDRHCGALPGERAKSPGPDIGQPVGRDPPRAGLVTRIARALAARGSRRARQAGVGR